MKNYQIRLFSAGKIEIFQYVSYHEICSSFSSIKIVCERTAGIRHIFIRSIIEVYETKLIEVPEYVFEASWPKDIDVKLWPKLKNQRYLISEKVFQ
jgi:hypothetical protein